MDTFSRVKHPIIRSIVVRGGLNVNYAMQHLQTTRSHGGVRRPRSAYSRSVFSNETPSVTFDKNLHIFRLVHHSTASHLQVLFLDFVFSWTWTLLNLNRCICQIWTEATISKYMYIIEACNNAIQNLSYVYAEQSIHTYNHTVTNIHNTRSFIHTPWENKAVIVCKGASTLAH